MLHVRHYVNVIIITMFFTSYEERLLGEYYIKSHKIVKFNVQCLSQVNLFCDS